MPISHLLLALLVVVIWGINFIFVKLGLEEINPLLLCSLRFLCASVPAVFFVKPPAVPFKIIAAYGLIMFALQFALTFTGMHVGMTPGMGSLLMQVQVFFSIFFAMLLLGERPKLGQISGALVSFSGIGLVALHLDHEVTMLGFVFMIAAAATWGVGNLITKQLKGANMVSVIVWGSFIACFPMFTLALLIEGPQSFVTTYEHVTIKGISALIYIVYASTWIGYGIWNWLICRYPVGVVVPFSLLVPVISILVSVIMFGEAFQLWKLVACLLVISGLCINIISSRFVGFRAQAKAA